MAFARLDEQVMSLGVRLRLLRMAFRRMDRIPAVVLISLATEDTSESPSTGGLSPWEIQVLDGYTSRG